MSSERAEVNFGANCAPWPNADVRNRVAGRQEGSKRTPDRRDEIASAKPLKSQAQAGALGDAREASDARFDCPPQGSLVRGGLVSKDLLDRGDVVVADPPIE